jgi:hypothetical protein
MLIIDNSAWPQVWPAAPALQSNCGRVPGARSCLVRSACPDTVDDTGVVIDRPGDRRAPA